MAITHLSGNKRSVPGVSQPTITLSVVYLYRPFYPLLLSLTAGEEEQVLAGEEEQVWASLREVTTGEEEQVLASLREVTVGEEEQVLAYLRGVPTGEQERLFAAPVENLEPAQSDDPYSDLLLRS